MATRYVEPAERMYEDARTLHESGCHGTSDHLYGLSAECALKAILVGRGSISTDPPEKRFKIHVDRLWDEYNAVLGGLPGTVHALGSNPFRGWLADHRYLDDAAFTTARLTEHRQGATAAMEALDAARQLGMVT